MVLQDRYLIPTIDVESWVCSDFFSTEHTNVHETSTILAPLKKILGILRKYQAQTTFFVLGETATTLPEIVEIILQDGHEVASHSLTHTSITKLGRDEFLRDVKKSKNILESMTKEKIGGFRAPNAKIDDKILLLEQLGFEYDSSVVASMKIPGWYGGLSNKKYPYKLMELFDKEPMSGTDVLEFPISVHPMLKLPVGGWWLRNLGYRYSLNGIQLSLKKYGYANFYLHPWEFQEQNKIVKAPFHVFRRTGNYVIKAFDSIVKNTKDLGRIARIDDLVDYY